jgi:multiple sugar transport system substrate-binding protein
MSQQKEHYPSRRDFLRIGATATGAALLAACAPAATPQVIKETVEVQKVVQQTVEVLQTQVVQQTVVVAPTLAATPVPLPPGVVKFSRYSAFTGQERFYNLLFSLWKERNPGCTVEAEFAGGDTYWTRVQTEIAAGTTPDVGIADYGRTVTFAKDGVLLELGPYIDADKYPLDPVPPATLAQYMWKDGDFDSGGDGGKIFGLPYDAQPYIIVYNKTLFDKAGVATPTDAWTLDDFVQTAKQLTKPSEDKWGTYLPDTWGMLGGEFVYSAGGEIISKDYKTSGLDMPETISAYKWAWDLVYTHKVAPHPVPSEAVNPFASGRVAMYHGGVWWINDFATITDFEWDVAYYPKNPTTGKRTMTAQSDGWWMYKQAANNPRAWDFFKFMMSTEVQGKLSDMNMGVPPVRADLSKIWYGKTPPANRTLAREQLLADNRKISYTFYDNTNILSAVTPIFDKAFYDGQDVEVQAKAAAKAMTDGLTKAWAKFSG